MFSILKIASCKTHGRKDEKKRKKVKIKKTTNRSYFKQEEALGLFEFWIAQICNPI